MGTLLSKRVLVVLVGLLVVAGGTGAYFYKQYKSTKVELTNLLEDPTAINSAEVERLIEEVGAITDLPQDERPTVATVTDVDRLREQAFFARAENGDKVLIYTEAKRAILYRPSTGKVIEIAPLNIGAQTEEAPVEEETSEEDTSVIEEEQTTTEE